MNTPTRMIWITCSSLVALSAVADDTTSTEEHDPRQQAAETEVWEPVPPWCQPLREEPRPMPSYSSMAVAWRPGRPKRVGRRCGVSRAMP